MLQLLCIGILKVVVLSITIFFFFSYAFHEPQLVSHETASILSSAYTHSQTDLKYLGDGDDEWVVRVKHVISKHQVDEWIGVCVQTKVLVIVTTEAVSYRHSNHLYWRRSYLSLLAPQCRHHLWELFRFIGLLDCDKSAPRQSRIMWTVFRFFIVNDLFFILLFSLVSVWFSAMTLRCFWALVKHYIMNTRSSISHHSIHPGCVQR